MIEDIHPKREREVENSFGGGGFLNICLSILDINDPLSEENSAISKKFLESGIKKVFIIGLVLDVSDNYVNVKILIGFWRGHLEEKIRNSNRFKPVQNSSCNDE